jgi:phosphoglycolate phosphatase
VETLGLLRSEGYRLGVCTNKLERLAQILLGELELDRFFDAIVGSDSVGARKPHPASLLETVRRLGSGRSSGVVMVGDSEADEGAARNAGVSVVLVEYGYSGVPPASLVPDALIGEFAALPNALERLSQDVVPGEGRSGTYCPSAVASLLEGGR